MAYPIVPEKCKIRPAGKRIELKLKKCSPELWNELEDLKKKRELEEAKKHIENVETSGRGEMLSEEKEEQVSVDINKECDGETVNFAVGGKQDNVAMETEELVQEVEDTVAVESMDTEVVCFTVLVHVVHVYVHLHVHVHGHVHVLHVHVHVLWYICKIHVCVHYT